MKTKLSLIALVSLAAFGASVHAAPARAYAPAGEAVEPNDRLALPTTTDTTRVAVKAETVQARRTGELQAAGEATGSRELRAEVRRPSVLARADVKAQTREAVRNGTIAPFGEAADVITQ